MRTFAMSVVSAANAALLGAVLFFFVVIAAPLANEPEAAILFPVFGVFGTVFGVIAILAAWWTGARRRAWFWVVAGAPGLVFLALNRRYIPYDITHPATTSPFLLSIVVVAGALAVVVGGIAAFLDVRRGRATWTRGGSAGFLISGVIGVLVGAAATSLLAGSASADGGGVAEAPTVTGVVTAENTTFVESELAMKNQEVLGLFVTNRDGIGHSFDVDSLGIHVELPPDSTTAVAIKPTEPGNLQFYCNVPGHRDAGMVGTITVE
jgi:uncharacterized cupredoxin-like copper-binding protein